MHIIKQAEHYSPPVPFPDAHGLNPVCQMIRRQRGHAVCGVIVDVFHGEGEAGHLIHGIAVIIVLAVIRTQVKLPDLRCLLMAHVYTLLMLRPKDAVHVIDVLIAAVVGFRAPNLNLMLKNSRHTWFCIALVAVVGNIILLRTFTYDKETLWEVGQY